jgi:hypothetical protein
VTGSPESRLRRTETFERSLQQLIRSHYKKNKGGLKDFLELLTKKLGALAVGSPLSNTSLEPWPAQTFAEGWQLWKHYFSMPGLSGAAGEGRLIFLMRSDKSSVLPLWVYTHKDFSGRPPDSELKGAINPEVAPEPAE